jgi:glycosyltransferase involved in cell wall biosynthesis
VKAFLYNNHWQTFGGGELYLIEVGISLQTMGIETILCGSGLNKFYLDKAAILFKRKLSKFKVLEKEESWRNEIKADDIFINGCYGSTLPAPTENSVLIVHYPYTRMPSFLVRKANLSPLFIDLEGNIRVPFKRILNTSQAGRLIGFLNEDNQNSKTTDGKSGVNLLEVMKPNPSQLFLKKYSAFKNSYRQVWCNSEFIKQITNKKWNISAEVVYPPCGNLRSFGNKTKKIANNFHIVCVGRFVHPWSRGHTKRQDLMLKEFVKLQKTLGTECKLTLIGSISSSYLDQLFLKSLIRKSRNLNVQIYPGLSAELKEKIMDEATFLWHGAGLRTRKTRKQEHFGMAIVEAMVAGLIPIVSDNAGPAEILDKFPRLRAQRTSDFAKITQTLSGDEIRSLRNSLQKEADLFSNNAFRDQTISLLWSLIGPND